jgi:hypothetical protein
VQAKNYEDALYKVKENDFDESDKLCDKILILDEFLYSKKNIAKILKAEHKFFKEANEHQLDPDDFSGKDIVDAIYNILVKKIKCL